MGTILSWWALPRPNSECLMVGMPGLGHGAEEGDRLLRVQVPPSKARLGPLHLQVHMKTRPQFPHVSHIAF